MNYCTIYRTHPRLSIKYMIIYWNMTIIGSNSVGIFLMNHRHACIAPCLFSHKVIFDFFYVIAVLSRRLSHFDRHICFFVFVPRCKKTDILSQVLLHLYGNICMFMMLHNHILKNYIHWIKRIMNCL